MRTADERLQSEVLDELRWDPSVDASAIGVTAADGVVTLYGEIPSWEMKLDTIAAAARVPGVRALAEHLTFRCPGSLLHTDTDLAREIADVLRQAGCPPTIKVEVHDGDARLDGFADWPFQRQMAEAAVNKARSRLSDLRTFSNDVVVSKPTTLPRVLARAVS
jgi:osmotically-inducible protein OsmY